MSTDEEDLLKKEMEEMKVRLFIANSKLRKANSSGGADTTQLSSDIGGTGSTLTDKINDINTNLGGTGTTLTNKINDINTDLGGTGTTLTNKINDINTNLGGSGTTIARVDDINTNLGGSGTTNARVSNVKANLGGTGNVDERISNMKTKIGGSGTVDTSLDDIANSITYQLVNTNSSDFELISYNGNIDYQFKDPIFNHPQTENFSIVIEGNYYPLQKILILVMEILIHQYNKMMKLHLLLEQNHWF